MSLLVWSVVSLAFFACFVKSFVYTNNTKETEFHESRLCFSRRFVHLGEPSDLSEVYLRSQSGASVTMTLLVAMYH